MIWRAVSRDLFTDPLFRGNDEIVAWCLMFARYARAFDDDASGLKRGQFKCSRPELTRRFQKSVDRDPSRNDPNRWTLAKTRSFLARMEKHGALKSERSADEYGRPVVLFTVQNFDKWQSTGQQTEKQTERTPNSRPSTNRIADSNADGSEQIAPPMADRIADQAQTEKQTERTPNSRHRETVFLETEILETKTPARSRVVSDETGTEWPEPSADFEYPASFKTIWADWKAAAKVCKVTANGKLAAYKQIRQHIKAKTLTLAQIQQATGRFLKKHKGEPKLYGAPQPPRFYGKQGDIFEYLTAADESETPESIRQRWHNPRDAWRECVSLANHLGVRIPEVPKRAYGAEWEDVEKFHPLIVEFATDRSGFKAVPDDLAGRIQGAQ